MLSPIIVTGDGLQYLRTLARGVKRADISPQGRLGITAPRDIVVHRQELWDRMCAEELTAPAENIPDVPASTPEMALKN